MKALRVFTIAGEPSGDRLGAALMAGLKELSPGVEITGVGGPMMTDEGLHSLFPMDEISIMGITEILKEYRALKARIRETAEAVLAARPDVLVTVDLPEFCLRVARLVRTGDPSIRICHYVAPTVWAWRPGRARKMAPHVDQVLALLPFEPPFMQAAGMRCDFVGHPVVTEHRATEAEGAAFRAAHGLDDDPLLMVLPGSRRTEVGRLAPIFGEVLRLLLVRRPDLRVVLPAARAVAPLVRAAASDWPGDPIVLDPEAPDAAAIKRAAFREADYALAASGTVSLELAATRTPMVVAYDMNWLSRQIIGRMLRTDTVTLVNLVSETRTVPEFIGNKCRPEAIAEALVQLMINAGPQRAALRTTMDRLGAGGEPPGLRAARAVLDGLAEARPQT